MFVPKQAAVNGVGFGPLSMATSGMFTLEVIVKPKLEGGGRGLILGESKPDGYYLIMRIGYKDKYYTTMFDVKEKFLERIISCDMIKPTGTKIRAKHIKSRILKTFMKARII